ncbi:hypothetical protein BS78_01G062900 [Paspalum vaginatum]|nr:hypothetical protein BS78_01G062900 [Paspalum vaginatum]
MSVSWRVGGASAEARDGASSTAAAGRGERGRRAAATVNPRDLPPLPVDVLIGIVARSDDVATIIRCAAAWKSLRAAILDPVFYKLLGLRVAANGGFDPNLLMAVSFRPSVFGTLFDPITFPPSSRNCLNATLLRSSEPVSYRDGLLVLRQSDKKFGELRVCNTITGDVTSLRRMKKVLGAGFTLQYIYRPALLSVNGGGRSFELLVMYLKFSTSHGARLETQTFSSEKAKWSTGRLIHLQHPDGVRFDFVETEESTAPAVVGRSVHWLCRSTTPGNFIILALDADSVEATAIDLPQELLASMMAPSFGVTSRWRCEKDLILAANAEGTKLSVIVAEKLAISTWTLQEQDEGPAGGVSWSRQVVVRRGEIGSQLHTVLDAYQPFRFIVFGETSGTLLFWICGVGLLQLNLGTKKVVAIWLGAAGDFNSNTQAVLQEINLVSLLKCMKHF